MSLHSSSMKKTVAIIGSRGMVGSVLITRMKEEGDFDRVEAIALTTSQQGQAAPDWSCESKLQDAYDTQSLRKYDMIITCQGSDYTERMHAPLRDSGWQGLWIDAASSLRYQDTSTLVLDPLNHQIIQDQLHAGHRDFIGSNCTVSLLLMGLAGLFKQDLVEFISTSSYQAISGSGARHMKELIAQMGYMAHKTNLQDSILEVDQQASSAMRDHGFPIGNIGAPLAGNLLPWIDCAVDFGQTKEEWKAMVEANKILGNHKPIPIDGNCVRVGSMRSHAQSATIKLKKNVPLDELEELLKSAHEWINFVPNNKEQTMKELTPAFTSGSMNISVGRIRKMRLGENFLNVFTVGDQLLWGAAEPLRRMMNIALEKKLKLRSFF
jgi:aspartate-semialdehyde dehydrogenase